MIAILARFFNFGTIFIFVAALSFIGNLQSIHAQTDTTFWFAVPEVANSHGDRPIFLRFTSQGQAASVTIDLPANPMFAPIVTAVAANGLASVNLTSFIDTLENGIANAALNKGLRIQSTAPITAYYEVSPSNNPDIFSLKGGSALGMNFMIPGQDIMENAHGRNVFDIIATEDNTEITITPTQALEGGRAAGVPFTITLQRGQTFSCRAAGTGVADKLIGSTVTSNKPIAITIIDDSVRGGEIYNGTCFDLLGDQLIPIEQLGLEFIVQRGFLDVHANNTNSRTERVIIMATQNNTAVYIDGNATAVATLAKGQTYHRRMGANLAVTHIRTDKPVYVLHISGFGCETGQAIIPAISCTGSSLVGFRRSTAEQMGIVIITRDVHKGNFQLNGVAYPISFTTVPGTANEWVYARIQAALNDTSAFNTQSAYLLRNTTGNFHLGIINGGSSTGCRYGYFSGFATVTVTATSNSTVEAPACQASPVFIEADSTALATYSWTGPNGLTSSLRRLDFNQVTFADTGLYTVTATVDNCVSSIDSITIRIKEKPNVASASNTGPYCDGASIQLFADTVQGVTYLWSGPAGFSSTDQHPVIPAASFANGGTYRLITLLDGCSSDTTTTDIYVYPVPVITPLGATTFCRYDSVALRTGGGVSYEWFYNGQLVSGQNDSILTVTQAGFYTAVVTNSFGCKDTADEVEVAVLPLPDKSIQSSGGTTICTGDSTLLWTNSGYTYAWYKDGILLADKTDSSFFTSQAGQYQVISTSSAGCVDSSAILQLSLNPVPKVNLDSAMGTRFCAGDSVLFQSLQHAGAQHNWFRNDSLIQQGSDTTIWVKTVGNYRLVVDLNGCTDSSVVFEVLVDTLPQLSLSASGALSFCMGDSVTLTSSTAAQYQWFLDDSLLTGATDSFYTAHTSGAYRVEGTNEQGCSNSSANMVVDVQMLPTAFISTTNPLNFCPGDSILITANGGQTYQWLRNDTLIAGITDSVLLVSSAANWSVIAINSFGCSDTSNQLATTINPIPSPTISANGPTTFCSADSVVLHANGGISYQWLRNDSLIVGATDSALTVTNAGHWAVIATNIFGCSDTSNTLSTTVNQLPTPVLNGNTPTTFCYGDSVVLTATAGNSYQWLRNDTLVAGVSDSFLTIYTTANWAVIATDTFGCSARSNVISTTVNPLAVPVISAAGPTTFCVEDSVTLIVTGGISFQWLRNDTIVAGATDSILTVSTAADWSVIATNTFGCPDTSNRISTTVNPLPTPLISAAGPTAFCFEDSVVLTASGGVSYQWLRNDSLITGATDSVLTVSTAANWSVIATNTFGCSDTSNSISTTVNALPTPVVSATGPTTFCIEDSVLLTATGGISYQWLRNDSLITGATDSVLTVSTAANWSVIATNSFGCTDTSNSISTTVNALPTPVVSATGPTTFCFEDSVVLTATGGISYQWLRNDSLITGATDSVLTVSTAANWSVIATNSLGCSDTSNFVSTTVNPLPTPVAIANGPTTFCFEDSVVLSASGGVSYQWLRNDSLITGATDSVLTVSTAANWSVIATNSLGCSDTSNFVSTTVNPLPTPVAIANGPTTFCFEDSVVLSASGGVSYQWLRNDSLITGATDSVLTVSTAANWSIIATNSLGCSDTSNFVSTTVNPLPTPVAIANGPTTFCFEDSVVLSASGGVSYQWLRNDTVVAGATDSVFTVSTAANWSVIATNNFGCSDTSNSISTTVNPLPTPVVSANGPTTFCFEDSVVLSASGGVSYQWLRNDTVVAGATDSVFTVSTAANWSVIAINSFGCSDTSNFVSTTVNPLPTPVVSANGPTTFCFEDSVVLNATGGISYQWLRNDSLITGATDSVLTVSTAANWSVIATNTFGCSDTSNFVSTTVNPLPTPVVSANGPTTFCFEDSVVLSASGGVSYQWLRNDSLIAGAIDSVLTVSTAANWSVIAINSFGCSDTSNSISTTVNPLPTPVVSATGPTTFCYEDSVVLSASGGISYQWLRNDTLITGANDSVLTVSTAANWSVIATNNFGCSDTSNSISTTVNPLPTPVVSANGPTTFCFEDSVVLNATGGISYQWLRNDSLITGATDSVLTVSTAANWSVIATNNFGCSDTSNSVSTTVNPLPTPVVSANGPTTFCFEDSVVLNATGGVSYQWLRNDSLITGATDSVLTVSTAANWSVIATNTFGCSDTSNFVSTTVNPLPTPVVSANGPTTFCFEDSVVLNATGGVSYQWLRNDSLITGATDSVLTVSTAANWSVIATNNFGCSDTSNSISTTVNPLPTPVVSANGPTTFCIEDSVLLTATGGISYQWLRNDSLITGATDSVLTVSTAANWSVIATNTFGCSDTSNSISTTINPLPTPVVSANGPTTFCFEDSVVLTATGGVTYQWLRNDSLIAGATDSVLTVSTAANWSVIATNTFGCSDTSNSISTTINPLPTPVVSANGPTTFCFEDSVLLTATGGISYQWLRNDSLITGATDSVLTVSTAANWSVIATNSFGCTDTSNSISTTVNALPTPVVSATGPTTFCIEDSVLLTATGGISYQWLRNDSLITGATDSVLTVSTAANWSVIATNSFGCTDTSNSISTTVNALPTPVVSATGPTTFCIEDSVLLTATGGISYQWLRNDSLITGATDSVLTVSTAANWSVIATNTFGCSDTSNSISTTVNDLPIPAISANGPTTFCYEDSVVLAATGGISYQWLRNDTLITGATDSVFTVSTAANWSLIATNSFGCSDTSNSISTTVNPLPTPVVSANGSTTFCFEDSVVLTATGGINYQWLRNDSLIAGATDSVLTVSTAANWSVIATNSFGCTDTSNSISTTVNALPTPVVSANGPTTFCFEDSVVLTATGGISYQWLRNDSLITGATDSVITASTAANWSVIATNTFGCSDTSNSISTTINPLPTPVVSANGPTTFCFEDSVVLTATGGVTYQWLRNDTLITGATDSVLTVSTAANWSVIATNTFGCPDTSNRISTTVNPLPTPVVSANGSTTFCFEDSVVLNATGGISYQWLRNDSLITGATDSVLTVSTAANWSVIATNSFGCTDTSNSISTTVNPLPTPVVSANGPTTFCFEDSVVLNATGGISYQWLRNDSLITGATDSVLTVSTAANWSIIATNSLGCSDTSNFVSTTVNPLPTPVAIANGPTTFCFEDSVVLSASGGVSYQWLRNDTVVAGATDSVFTVSTAANWSVIATNNFGCSDTSNSISTTVNPLPTPVVSANGPTTFCFEDSVLLTATGGISYQWLRNDSLITGATDSVLTVSTAANWSVIATNNFGCSDTSNSISTTVNPLPTPVVSANGPTTFCFEDSVVLSASGGVSYQWLRNDTVVAGATDSVFTVSTAANWSVIAINSFGCSDTSNFVSTTVNPLPTPVVSANGPTTFCFEDSVVLNATGGISYQWLRNDSLITGATDSVLTVSTAANWSVIATNTFGCSDTSNFVSTTVNPLPTPVVSANGPTTFCFEDSVVLNATGGISYQWLRNDSLITGATDSVLTVSTAANWSVIATNTFGCSDTSNFVSTTVNPLPTPVVSANGPTTFCFEDSVLLTATGGISYQWLRNDSLITGATDSVLTVSTAANWSVIATNTFGCSDTSNSISTTVNDLPIPAISANGPTTFCYEDSVVLAATGGISYQWLRNDTLITGATDSVFTVSTAANWSVIATNTFGCSDTSNSISTTVNPLPTPVVSATGPTTFCYEDSVVLSASGGISYQWLRNDSLITGATDSVLTVSTAANWSVIATNTFGCSDTSNSISTTINPLPTPVVSANGPTTFCFEDSVVLTATGGVTYQWLRNDSLIAGATDSVLTVSTAANWSVIATNTFGCSDTSNSISTTINPLPTPVVSANGPTTFCFEDSVVLNATGGVSYQWLRNDSLITGATDSVLTVSTAANWSVIATNNFGCSDTSNSISTTVNPLPTPVVSANGPTTFCFEDSVVLNATGGVSYQWLRNDTLITGANDSVLTVSTAANWSVIATNTFGCSDTSNSVSTTLNDLPTPIITANGPTTFCFKDSVVLSATGGIAYQWLRNDTLINGATDSVLTVSTAAGWSVIASNAFGCSDNSNYISTTVNPLPLPVITTSGPTTFCLGDSVVLTASGGTNYKWLRNDTLVAGTNDSALTVSIAGNWSVIATNIFGCSDTSTWITTSLLALPHAEIASQGPQHNCVGDSIMLTSSAGTAYQWLLNGFPIPGAQQMNYTAWQTGSYSVIVYNAGNCSDSSNQISLFFHSRLQPTVQFFNTPVFCPGDTVIMFTISAQNYQWFRDGVAIPGATDSVYHSTIPGLYSVQVINANGCESVSPQAAIELLSNTNTFRILANNVVVCAGDSALLAINAVPNTQYQWMKDGVAIPFANQTSYYATTSGLYSCIITYNQRCTQEVNGVFVNVNPIPPSPIASANGPVCRYTDLELYASMVPNASYYWQGPGGYSSTLPNPVISGVNFQHTGWYRLRINVDGCDSYEDSVYVGVQYEIPEVEIQGRRTYCPGEVLKLNADSLLHASYRWILPSGDTIANRLLRLELNEATDAAQYILEVSRGGCVDYYTEIIRVIALELIFPTAFTPNGDGLNESFFPVGNYQGSYELEIYDRWGKKVFHSFRPEDGWDGTMYGEAVESGTYTYVYRYEDCSNRPAIGKGSMQLIR